MPKIWPHKSWAARWAGGKDPFETPRMQGLREPQANQNETKSSAMIKHRQTYSPLAATHHRKHPGASAKLGWHQHPPKANFLQDRSVSGTRRFSSGLVSHPHFCRVRLLICSCAKAKRFVLWIPRAQFTSTSLSSDRDEEVRIPNSHAFISMFGISNWTLHGALFSVVLLPFLELSQNVFLPSKQTAVWISLSKLEAGVAEFRRSQKKSCEDGWTVPTRNVGDRFIDSMVAGVQQTNYEQYLFLPNAFPWFVSRMMLRR